MPYHCKWCSVNKSHAKSPLGIALNLHKYDIILRKAPQSIPPSSLKASKAKQTKAKQNETKQSQPHLINAQLNKANLWAQRSN